MPTIAQLPDLIPYRKGDLWGYCDSNKVVKIEPRFLHAGWFNELGQAYVMLPYGDSIYLNNSSKQLYINTKELITEHQFYELDSQFYYYFPGQKNVVAVNRLTGEKKEYSYDYVKVNHSPKYLLWQFSDTLAIHFANQGIHKFKVPKNIIIDEILNDETLIYSREPNTELKIYNDFEKGVYIIYSDTFGNKYLISKNGNMVTLINSYILEEKENDVFIIFSGNRTVIYNNEGKHLFTIEGEGHVRSYGKHFFVTLSPGSDYYSVFDSKGSQVGNIYPSKTDDYQNYGFNYFTDNDSCYVFISLSQAIGKLCRIHDKFRVKGNLLMFTNTNSKFDIYNNNFQLVYPNLQADEIILKTPYINDLNFTTYRYKNKTYLINTDGLTIPLPDSLVSVIPINRKYFVGFCGTSFNYAGVIFDSTGSILHTIPNFDRNIWTMQNFHPYSRDSMIVIPNEYQITNSENKKIVIYSILRDTCIHHTFEGRYFCSALLNEYYYMPYIINFCKITEDRRSEIDNNLPVYYYIDKYGTIYYDE